MIFCGPGKTTSTIISTLLYSLTFEQFLMHLFSTCVPGVSHFAWHLYKKLLYSTYNIQLLDKCLRGNKIASLRHMRLPSLSTCAKGVQFYYPSHTYPAILYCTSIFNFQITVTSHLHQWLQFKLVSIQMIL